MARKLAPYPPRRSKAHFTDDDLRTVAATLQPARTARDWYRALQEGLHAFKPDAPRLSYCTVVNRCYDATPPIFAARIYSRGVA